MGKAKRTRTKSQAVAKEVKSVLDLAAEFSRATPRWQHMLSGYPFNIAKLKPMSSVDSVTRRWIRHGCDERAAQEGFRFDEERGLFTVDWVQNFCCLYEGDLAGEQMILDDWQLEFFMQVYGWTYFEPSWNRWIRRFREASAWIPKKNAKSPTLAANGLYLLCGDNEYGQKCYTIARDSKQGMISHKHAMEMVKASEELSRECTVSLTTKTITHHPTSSEYILSSLENAQSKEGYNGNLLVDEVHVVDFAAMKRVKRASISRSEPLHIEVSTVGDDLAGYGSARYRICERILSGELYKPRHFVMNFSIDQKTSLDTLLNKDEVTRLGRLVNPTIGRIIREFEYINDWTDSCESQSELMNFAMYRLNRWSAASANWIPYSDWSRLGRKYTLAQLKKYPCFIGMDLSKTTDMTAVVVVFAVPHKKLGVVPYLWPLFWLPEPTAERYKANIDFFSPEFVNEINFCSDKTIDYSDVADVLNQFYEEYDLRGVGYDPARSDKLVSELIDVHGWPAEDFLVKIPQTMLYLGPITEDFERLVLKQALVHPDSNVLNWQMSHVKVEYQKKASTGLKKPVKPGGGDHKKIDGVVASIMGVAMMLRDPEIMAAYEEQGSLLLYPTSKE